MAERVQGIGRRQFLALTGTALLWPALPARGDEGSGAPPTKAKPLDPTLGKALESSNFVYVSPIQSNGEESHCHGEVWYGYLDGAAVLITSTQSWKVRALVRGLDRAKVWVGSYGRWKRLVGFNESFRKAPSFEARVEFVRDEALLERLLETFDRKYPDEIKRWRKRMRDEYMAGTRVLLRYVPV